MILRFPFTFLLVLSCRCLVWAQDTSRTGESPGTSALWSRNLSQVVVRAFEEHKRLIDEPSPVFYLPASSLERYGHSSILHAVNTIPGVRMEQRSPASFRLNIRGSSLRSPFGVREVKVYYDGIPCTDPGGDTYLNQFSFRDFGNLTVIKGPAGSLYGAGIGGVLLIQSPLMASLEDSGGQAALELRAGSFGLQGTDAFLQWKQGGSRTRINYSETSSDGYREHTGMHQQTFTYTSLIHEGPRQEWTLFAHYNDLYYQTPGGLNATEFARDPRQARPKAGPFLSADQSQAAVFQKNFLLGISQRYRFNDQWQNTTALYGAYTDFTNPTFRVYKLRKEPYLGARSVLRFRHILRGSQLSFWAGTEIQKGFFSENDYGNLNGSADSLENLYHINNFQLTLFTQGDWQWLNGWDITAGASLNYSSLAFMHLYPNPASNQARGFHNDLVPRIALLKRISKGISFYGSLSYGFSPPTESELLPSTAVLNTSLQAEQGSDLELGTRGRILGQKLYFDINAFIFNLSQSISQRRDSSGADYYVNAGGALQHGLEAFLSYQAYRDPASLISGISLWTSQTWFHSRYRNYKVLTADYSGNKLPGAAPYTSVSGLDLVSRTGLSLHLSWNYTGPIPLNDANTVQASAYNLLDLQLQYRHVLADGYSLSLFAGGDNLLQANYSLGDDINAAAGRYYNPAPGINFFAGARLHLGW